MSCFSGARGEPEPHNSGVDRNAAEAFGWRSESRWGPCDPIHGAFIAIMCLMVVMSANWLLGVSGLLLVVSIAVVRIPVGERQLRERFGEAWERYRAETGAILPRVWR